MMHKIGLILLLLLFSLFAMSQDSSVGALRIMSYNIQHGAGMDNVVDLDRQAEVIRGVLPDVVGLQEVDSAARRSSRVYQAGYLAQSLGMYATFGPAIPLTGGKYGVAILSKEKPLTVRNIPLPGAEARTLLVCEFQSFVFACTHLALEEENRLASMPVILEEVARWDKPFFICGDWNDTPTSNFMKKMREKFTIMSGTINNKANYTFPADNPTTIIDYIASYGRAFNSIKKRTVVNAPDASDHRPIMVDATFELPLGISLPSAGDNASGQKDAAYNLSGQRIGSDSQQGILIRKGRKVATK